MMSEVIGDVQTIDDVVRSMRALDALLPDDDGVKWFNFLYLNVTEAVRAERTGWHDWIFLERLDVVFARLYFEALTTWEREPAQIARSWRPLFENRYDRKLARIQLALAGMNAHINHDLATALERMAVSEGAFPPKDGERHTDFRRVNDLLERLEAALRGVLATGLAGTIDEALGDVDSIFLMWKVRNARDAAWTNGEVLWHLRGAPFLQRDYRGRLDRMVAFAGRGLLVPRLTRGATGV